MLQRSPVGQTSSTHTVSFIHIMDVAYNQNSTMFKISPINLWPVHTYSTLKHTEI